MSRKFRALALATLGLACASSGTTEQPGVARSPVVGGEPSPLGGIEDAVLMLRIQFDSGELVCSSALVAPNLAVTARHCVSHFVDGNFTCTVQGELESIDANAGVLGSHFAAATLEFYDGHTPRTKPIAYGAQVLSTLSDTVCTNDLAFVVLDRSLSLPVLPLRLNGRARIGESVTLVGYGFDDDMVGGDFLDVTTQRRTHNTSLVIDEVEPLANADVTSTPPRTIVVKGPSGCVGDSGGPLLSRDTHALLGVDSLSSDGSCTSNSVRNLFTHVPDFQLLSADAFKTAGYEPTPETPAGEPDPMSEAGRGGAPNEPAEAGAPAAGGTDVNNAAGSSALSGSGGSALDGTGGTSAELAGAPASEGGAPASEGGAPGTTSTGGDSAGSPSRRASRARGNGGCTLAAGAPRPGTAWPFVVLVSVLERVFRVRRRHRVGLLGPTLRRE